jgi:hypothetical protein
MRHLFDNDNDTYKISVKHQNISATNKKTKVRKSKITENVTGPFSIIPSESWILKKIMQLDLLEHR